MSGERQCYYRFDADTLHEHAERSTRRVIMLTAAMMVVEILGGAMFGSMALLADGWHMATHVTALGITAFAYYYARKHADSARYSFGTGKIGVLGGFASGVALLVVALMMALESAARLFRPGTISFDEAIGIALLGLAVNLLSAWWLRENHNHDHGDSRSHARDHNLRAAYLHVLADALTSVLAIVALGCGKLLGWIWMDSLSGIIGSAVIARWCHGLLRDSAGILLDRHGDDATLDVIRGAVERDGQSRIADLHVWYIAPHQLAAIIAVDTPIPRSPSYYQSLLAKVQQLVHVTVEVNHRPATCGDAAR
jgi:cation diffusion facilitator family transporter